MRSRVLVVAAAVALGIAAELAAFDLADVHLWLPDLLVGWVLVGCGLLGAVRRPDSRAGALLAATGFAWFLGNFTGVQVEAVSWLAGQLVYLHRGFLAHLIVAYPQGSAASRPARVAVAAGYVAALLPVLWEDATATTVLAALLVGYCAIELRRSRGPRRRARRQALWAATGLGLVLAAGALARTALPIEPVGRPSLLAYQAVLCVIAVGLMVGLIDTDQERVDITDLVVELGTARTTTLRASLARALGDPSLDVGYWFAELGAFITGDGQPLAVPDPASQRSVTYVEHDGERVAALVHDPAVLEDPGVREAVDRATRLAAANSHLQAEVRARVLDLEASRQRVLATRDDERMRLEARLHDGAEHRLVEVEGMLRGTTMSSALGHAPTGHLARAEELVQHAREDLVRLARGIHPRVLSEEGLRAAVQALAEGLPARLDLEIEPGRLPAPVEAAAYFVCAEGLANVAKYAAASRVRVSVAAHDTYLSVVVEDDGVGGADPSRGSGLRGLADRVGAVGGTIRVDSTPGEGTRLTAEIPLSRS